MGQNNSVAGRPDSKSIAVAGKGTTSVLNLASDHVLMYDCSDEEVVSDSELNDGMWLRQVPY